MHKNGPCLLMILDGWGINPEKANNAVAISGTPCLEELADAYPETRLLCSGEAVGLPAGIMGNSEVGHLNLGAGLIWALALGLTLAFAVAFLGLGLGLFLGRVRGRLLGAGDAGRGQDECPAGDDCRDG